MQGSETQQVAEPSARTRWRPVKSLVMWSGGLDSTYALVRLLETTDDEVHAHHVQARVARDDGRPPGAHAAHETEAVEALRGLLAERYRPFRFSDSRVDLGGAGRPASETTVAAFCAAHAALAGGFTPFDRIVLGANADDDRGWRPDTLAYAFRRTLLLRVVRAVWECEEVPFVYLFSPRPTKQEEADALPIEVYAATASCRDPDAVESPLGEVRYRPCGVCPQCCARARVVHRTLAAGADGEPVTEPG